MKYRRLGKTDIKVSVIGVGTWQFGGEWGKTFAQEEVDAILNRAQELGINLIDTAECYGDHLSEALIGKFIEKNKRQEWVLATKFGHKYHGYLDRTDHWRADEVIKQLDDSLQALRTDYIDIYQFHSCERQNLGVLAREPLANGLLSGKYKPGVVFGDNDWRSSKDRDKLSENLRLVEEIQRNKVPEGISLAQWALAWGLKHPAVTSVIPGCRDVSQLESNAAAAEFINEDHPQAWKS